MTVSFLRLLRFRLHAARQCTSALASASAWMSCCSTAELARRMRRTQAGGVLKVPKRACVLGSRKRLLTRVVWPV